MAELGKKQWGRVLGDAVTQSDENLVSMNSTSELVFMCCVFGMSEQGTEKVLLRPS